MLGRGAGSSERDNRPVVVLGCRLKQGVPGKTLTTRLKAALPLVADTPGRIVVVTGSGEAAAMKQWLVDHGLDPRRILCEDKATSTNENLENTVRLLGERIGPQGVVVVSNNFHAPRVKLWAWHHGFAVEMVSTLAPPGTRLYLYAREIVAFVHSAARIMWRRLLKKIDQLG